MTKKHKARHIAEPKPIPPARPAFPILNEPIVRDEPVEQPKPQDNNRGSFKRQGES